MPFISKEQSFEFFKENNPKYWKWLKKQELKEKIKTMKLEELEKVQSTYQGVQRIKKLKRYEEIINLRKEGLTQEQIGEKLHITRQRIQQISRKIYSEKPELKGLFGYKKTELASVFCKKCRNEFQIKSWSIGKIRTCPECRAQKILKTPEERKQERSAYQKNRYNTDPVFRRMYQRRLQKWRKKYEQEHPEMRERRLAQMKEYSKVYNENRRQKKMVEASKQLPPSTTTKPL